MNKVIYFLGTIYIFFKIVDNGSTRASIFDEGRFQTQASATSSISLKAKLAGNFGCHKRNKGQTLFPLVEKIGKKKHKDLVLSLIHLVQKMKIRSLIY